MHPRANAGCSEQAFPMEGNEISSHEGAPCSDMLHTPSAAYPKTGAQFPCAVHAFALGSNYLI